MIITIQQILDKFQLLLNGETSREDASSWAISLRDADDTGGLEYDPESKEDAIWKALGFLEGFDLKNDPDHYLHNVKDLEKAISVFNTMIQK